MKNLQAIILAGGKGTRMNQGKESPIPKALYQIAGRPMVSYILKTLSEIGITKPIIVVGYQAEMIKKELGNNYIYAQQRQRLGTGHAAKIGLESVHVNPEDVFILQSDDSAFYKKETLKRAITEHKKNKATITFLTTRIPGLTDYGRIIRAAPATPVSHRAGLRGGRDERGEVIDVVEKENMTKEQAKIDETNCGAYLVNTKWLKENIGKITRHHKGGREYPLPDIIKIALEQNKKVLGIQIDPKEWVGVNSPDQLIRAERMMKDKLDHE